MSKYTAVVSGDNLQSLQVKTLLSTQNLLDSMIEGRQFFTFGNRIVNCQKIDIVRWLTEMNSNEFGGLALRNLLVNAVVSSEIKQGGSGAICLITLMFMLKRYSQDKTSGSKTLKIEEINKEVESLSRHTYRTSTKNILEIISRLNRDPTSYEIFKRSVLSAGSSGSIYIEKHATDNTVIENRKGYEFPGFVPDVFLSASGRTGILDFRRCKVCIIDGLIERVSEINGLIHNSYKDSTPLVIVARGFNDDVQNTLGVNFQTGNLSVVPFCVPYDILGANLVNDICVVSGCDLVSSLKGDIISAIDWPSVPTVDRVSINLLNKSLIIQNERTSSRVLMHRESIRKNYSMHKHVTTSWQGLEEDMKGDVLEKRLSSLSGDGIRLSVGADLGDAWGITKDRIETQIKILKDGSKNGVLNIKDSLEFVKSRDLKILLNTLTNVSPILTSRGLFAGIKTGIGATKMIGEVGGIVYFDQ